MIIGVNVDHIKDIAIIKELMYEITLGWSLFLEELRIV